MILKNGLTIFIECLGPYQDAKRSHKQLDWSITHKEVFIFLFIFHLEIKRSANIKFLFNKIYPQSTKLYRIRNIFFLPCASTFVVPNKCFKCRNNGCHNIWHHQKKRFFLLYFCFSVSGILLVRYPSLL